MFLFSLLNSYSSLLILHLANFEVLALSHLQQVPIYGQNLSKKDKKTLKVAPYIRCNDNLHNESEQGPRAVFFNEECAA